MEGNTPAISLCLSKGKAQSSCVTLTAFCKVRGQLRSYSQTVNPTQARMVCKCSKLEKPSKYSKNLSPKRFTP